MYVQHCCLMLLILLEKTMGKYLEIVCFRHILLDFFSGKMTPSSEAVWDFNSSIIVGYPTTEHIVPFGITITEDDVLYISDYAYHRIVYISLNLSRNISFIRSSPFYYELYYPMDVFVKDDSLYVLCSAYFQVRKMSLNGSHSTIVLNFQNIRPAHYLYVDSNDKIYLNSFFSPGLPFISLVAILTPLNLGSKHLPDIPVIQTISPFGIYINKMGTIYISDHSGHKIVRWSPETESIAVVAGDGIPGLELRHLYYPTQVIVDEEEYMYISESAARRITRWTPYATFGVCIAGCASIYDPHFVHYQYITPYSLAFDSNGSLYASDQSSKVVKFQSHIVKSK